ncbi:hypothetical protein EIN_087210 [Entamoeba invadens IP1]|uniref:hypothetical protein n=1 Tax=Entamoeba invadens IP1 TaxID=370355 RepID=UPI0002C3E153|nr:hypothetical protein EIN_087210 [Entamoeba invadens IP1]ELP85419.1 hypothetical protein EIN_087210 [Entamoeba invadens IP1]|eukprot:XP_004184765.1 hypothetical protein EIN_087210 [Entamoeba invadens IP1]
MDSLHISCFTKPNKRTESPLVFHTHLGATAARKRCNSTDLCKQDFCHTVFMERCQTENGHTMSSLDFDEEDEEIVNLLSQMTINKQQNRRISLDERCHNPAPSFSLFTCHNEKRNSFNVM